MFSKFGYFHSPHGHSSHDLEDAPDKPPTLFISIIVILTFAFVFVLIYVSFPITSKIISVMQDDSNTGMGNEARVLYLQKQKDILYPSKKSENEGFPMSIDNAMDSVVQRQGIED